MVKKKQSKKDKKAIKNSKQKLTKSTKSKSTKPKKNWKSFFKSKKKSKIGLYKNLSGTKSKPKTKKPKQKKPLLKRIFSKNTFFWIIKIMLVLFILGVIGIISIFAYYKKQIEDINPEEVSNSIKTTVNTYYDRKGRILWEDKGDGNYTLAVKSSNINDYVKKATVAIEDKSFYEHHGISFWGLARAFISNLKGGSVQGGSTLTQQLIKQAFFAKEAHKRGLNGIPRKIKEMILAVQLERLYTKDQIITMYLNESSYGGRRNGIESGALTYFGKHAKDLNLAEAALLAGIPNQPGLYDPYNTAGNKYLIKRQHKVLDDMVKVGYITKKEAKEAKEVNVLDTLKPESDQWGDIKAPHFVIEAKKELETKFGVKVVRSGGLKIITTIDLDAQTAAEAAVAEAYKMSSWIGSDNIALGSVDVKTGQIIAMVGSVDFNKPGYGQTNAAVAELEPGSSIKPIVDFAPLFMKRPGFNYGPGSILKDEDIRNIYCVGAGPGCNVQNYTRGTYGNITIRESLGCSLNRPAIKAMHIVGVDKAIDIARRLGDKSYCKTSNYVGLSSAIGGGCTLRLIEHANAYASLGRGGVYQPLEYLLEVKNHNGKELYKWQEKKGEQVIDPQSAYMVSSILSDPAARVKVFGSSGYSYGFVVPGVWTASKTGTTENGHGRAKDSWMMSYSPVVATGVWTGNHDGVPLKSDSNSLVRRAMNNYMETVHKNIYAKDGRWKSGDKIAQPKGIKKMTFMGHTDIWPSWFDTENLKKEKMVFDKVSKKKATECTPELAKTEAEVFKFLDPYTKKDSFSALGGYDANRVDDVHVCGEPIPTITSLSTTQIDGNKYEINADISSGSAPIKSIAVSINGSIAYETTGDKNAISFEYAFQDSDSSISITVTDDKYYQTTKTISGPAIVVAEDPRPSPEPESELNFDSNTENNDN